MISDILTAIIVILMAVLVIYPTTRLLMQSWQNWQRRHGAGAERGDEGGEMAGRR